MLFNPSTLPFLQFVYIYCYIISIDVLCMSAVAEVKQKDKKYTLNPLPVSNLLAEVRATGEKMQKKSFSCKQPYNNTEGRTVVAVTQQ